MYPRPPLVQAAACSLCLTPMPSWRGGLCDMDPQPFLGRFVDRPAAFAEVHSLQFRGWADRVGLLLLKSFLPYLQLALIPLPKLVPARVSQGLFNGVKGGRGSTPPPPARAAPHRSMAQCPVSE